MKNGNWFKEHKILTIVLGVIIVGVIAAATGGSSTKDSVSQNETQPTVDTTQATAEENQPAVSAEFKSALAKAKSYSSVQHMSKARLSEQLTSEYGEKFSPEAAQYAIDNVGADWNANALAKAKSYQTEQSMSPARIRDQLSSDYGEKFTPAEADYAIQNL